MGFYVYLHCTPEGLPFYVGKGKGRRAEDFARRSDAHKQVVAAHGREQIGVFVFDCETEGAAFADEKAHIRQLRDEGVALVNVAGGGQGTSGVKLTSEAIERLRAINRGHQYNVGRKATAQRRQRLSMSLKGNKFSLGHRHSEESKRKVSQALKGKTHRDSFALTATKEERAKLAADYLSGIGLLTLAEIYRRSHKTLRKMLLADGVEIRPTGLHPAVEQKASVAP